MNLWGGFGYLICFLSDNNVKKLKNIFELLPEDANLNCGTLLSCLILKPINDSMPYSLAPQEHPALKMRVNIEPASAEPLQIGVR